MLFDIFPVLFRFIYQHCSNILFSDMYASHFRDGKKGFSTHSFYVGIVRAINVIRKLIRYKWIEFQVRPIGKKADWRVRCDVWVATPDDELFWCHGASFAEITFYVIALFENCQLWLNFLLIFTLILFFCKKKLSLIKLYQRIFIFYVKF